MFKLLLQDTGQLSINVWKLLWSVFICAYVYEFICFCKAARSSFIEASSSLRSWSTEPVEVSVFNLILNSRVNLYLQHLNLRAYVCIQPSFITSFWSSMLSSISGPFPQVWFNQPVYCIFSFFSWHPYTIAKISGITKTAEQLLW